MLILHFTRKSVKYKPMTSKKTSKFRLVVLCGGLDGTRNFAQFLSKFCDNLESPEIDIQPVYFDYRRQAYAILAGRSTQTHHPTSTSNFKMAEKLSKRALIKLFKDADLVFPVMHGAFGEDGQIQAILEKPKRDTLDLLHRPVKLPSTSTNRTSSSTRTTFRLFRRHFSSLTPQKRKPTNSRGIFQKHHISRAIVKPVSGGSSIGVHSVTTPKEALIAMRDIS